MGLELRGETCVVVETPRMDLFAQDRVECRGWQMQAHRPNLASHLLLQIKFYWHTVLFVSFWTISGCFCAAWGESSSCNINPNRLQNLQY